MSAAHDYLDLAAVSARPELSPVSSTVPMTDQAWMAETVFSMRWRIPLSIAFAAVTVAAPGLWYLAAEDTKITTMIEQMHDQNRRIGDLELGRSSADTKIGVLERSIDFIRDSLGRIEQKLDRNQIQGRH